MTEPTVEGRLARRFIVMSGDPAFPEALRRELPPGWQMAPVRSLDEVGEFQDVLLCRFILLDLDQAPGFDPVEVIRQVRMDMQLNIAIFCFGGDAATRDAARLARADRFFERGEMVERMKLFCHQYRW